VVRAPTAETRESERAHRASARSIVRRFFVGHFRLVVQGMRGTDNGNADTKLGSTSGRPGAVRQGSRISAFVQGSPSSRGRAPGRRQLPAPALTYGAVWSPRCVRIVAADDSMAWRFRAAMRERMGCMS